MARPSRPWLGQARAELILVSGAFEGVGACDRAGPHQPGQRLLERDRTAFARDGDLLGEMVQHVLANVPSRAEADAQHFHRRHAAAANVRHKPLPDNRRHGQRHFLANRILAPVRKRIADARDRAGDIGGVQAAEDQVAGLRRRSRTAHRFRIAHLADHQDVRRLPDGRARDAG